MCEEMPVTGVFVVIFVYKISTSTTLSLMSSKIWMCKPTCYPPWHNMESSKRTESQGEESSSLICLILGISEGQWSDPQRGAFPAKSDSFLSWDEHRSLCWFDQHMLLPLEEIAFERKLLLQVPSRQGELILLCWASECSPFPLEVQKNQSSLG